MAIALYWAHYINEHNHKKIAVRCVYAIAKQNYVKLPYEDGNSFDNMGNYKAVHEWYSEVMEQQRASFLVYAIGRMRKSSSIAALGRDVIQMISFMIVN